MTSGNALTALDIIVLLLVVGGAVFGALRGFVSEVLSLLAWVGAVMVLRLFYTPVSFKAEAWAGSASGGAVLAFAVLFFGAFILLKVVAGQLGARTRQSVVGPIDRVLGAGFGIVKGLIGASLLFLAVNLGYDMIWGKEEVRPAWMEASRTYPLLKITSRLIVDFVEERRNGEAAAEKGDGKGYSPRQREDLNGLLDAANALST